MGHLELWDKVAQPPDWALKEITGGRLKGKTDINPQWRYKALTEGFGICGIGWKYEIIKLWTEKGAGDEVFAFSKVNLYIKNGEMWSEAIPGIGGNMLIENESRGLHSNDEAFKMATTDALSVACKMLGIGSNVYSGSKYPTEKKPESLPKPEDKTAKLIALPDPIKAAFKALAYNRQEIENICEKYSWDNTKILEHLNAAGVK